MTFSTGIASNNSNDLLNGGGINTYSFDRNYSASEFAADTATIQDRDSLNDMEQIRVFGEWINSNGLFSDSLREFILFFLKSASLSGSVLKPTTHVMFGFFLSGNASFTAAKNNSFSVFFSMF